MVANARVVENVGVGAYLGGATLISDPVILDAAGSILTVEARHQTILNVLSLGSAIPQSFDIPLSPPEVLAIAGGFVSGCTIPINGMSDGQLLRIYIDITTLQQTRHLRSLIPALFNLALN
jgi:hypothetical protein